MHPKMRLLNMSKYSSSLFCPRTPCSIDRFHCDTIICGLLLMNPLLLPQRDKYDPVKDNLEIVYDTEPLYRDQINQTRICYETNLTHPQNVMYLRMIVDLNLQTNPTSATNSTLLILRTNVSFVESSTLEKGTDQKGGGTCSNISIITVTR